MSVNGLVEPVVDGAGVGRGEEVEVLAAAVEDRLAGLDEAVGHGVGLVRLRARRARSPGSRCGW